MIVATHMGMYMPALRPDWEKCLERGEPELQVRSRRKIDLLNLRVMMWEHGLFITDVVQLPNTDYQFRAYTTREDWGVALAQFAEDIDYTKFKDTPAKKHGDTALTNCYTKMWSAIFNAFPTGSIYAWSSKRGGWRGQRTTYTAVDEVPRWTKREKTTTTETVEWKRIADMTEREFQMFMEQDEPTEADLREIESENTVVDVTSSFMGVGPREVNGHLDHTHCTHASTKSARRRCRKAWFDVANS